MIRRRKIPGPAGRLPHLTNEERDLLFQSRSFATLLRENESLAKKLSLIEIDSHGIGNSDPSSASDCHQNDSNIDWDEEFNSPAWVGMCQKLGLPTYKSSTVRNMKQVNPPWIEWTIKDIHQKGFRKKIPYLIVMVKECRHLQSTMTFKDPTGEIQGSVYKKILEKLGNEIVRGTVFALRNISVWSPTPRKHYLNITPENLVFVISPSGYTFESETPELLPTSEHAIGENTSLFAERQVKNLADDDDRNRNLEDLLDPEFHESSESVSPVPNSEANLMRAIPQKAENSNQPILPARPKVVYAHRNPNTHQELTVMSIPSQSSMPPSTQVTPSMLNPRLAPSLGRRTQRSECSTQDEEIENEAKRVKIATNEGGKSVDDGIISFNSNESRNGSDKSSTQEKSLNRFAKWRNPKNQPSQKSISQSTVTHPSSAADPPLQTEQTSQANSQCSIAHQSSQSIQLRHPPKSQQKPQPYLVSQPDLDSLLDDVDLEGIEDLDSDLGNDHLHRQIAQTGSASDGTLQINVDANSIKVNGGITSTYSTRDQAIVPPMSGMDTSGKLRRFSFKKPAALSNTTKSPSVNPNPNSTSLPSHQSSMRYSTKTASRPPATRDLAVDATNARLASDRQSQPKFKFKPLNSQVNPSLVTSQQSLNHPPEDNISSATSAPESLKTPVNVMVNSNFQSAAGVTIAKGSKRDDSGIGDMDLDVDDEIDLDLDDALLDDLDVSGFQAATNLTSNLKAVRSNENQSTMGSAPLSTHLEVKSSMRGTVGARGNGANSGFGAGHMGVLKNVHTLIAEDDLEGLLDGLDELDDL